MIIYTILNVVSYLFLSLSNPTSLMFDSPIEYWTQSSDNSLTIYKSKDNKILTIKFLKDTKEAGFLVVTKKGPYSFKLIPKEASLAMSYQIEDAEPSTSFSTIHEDKSVEVLDGKRVYMVRVKSDKVKTVNDVPAKTVMFMPKNTKIKINDDFIEL